MSLKCRIDFWFNLNHMNLKLISYWSMFLFCTFQQMLPVARQCWFILLQPFHASVVLNCCPVAVRSPLVSISRKRSANWPMKMLGHLLDVQRLMDSNGQNWKHVEQFTITSISSPTYLLWMSLSMFYLILKITFQKNVTSKQLQQLRIWKPRDEPPRSRLFVGQGGIAFT